MKTLFLLTITFAICNHVHSQQCPQSVMKIQSPMCDTPRNLRIKPVNCTTAQLSWKGNKQQTYIVNATRTDAEGSTISETKQAKYNCNENGNCTATLTVREGERVNWNVQAVCNIRGAAIHSPVIEGKETLIPYCNAVAANDKTDAGSNNEAIRVYPNPTTGRLTVEYNSINAGVVYISIYNLAGKRMLQKNDVAAKGINRYAFDLGAIAQGVYYLELTNQAQQARVKFVIRR